MFITVLATLLFLIFLVLSAFHFYWLFGGAWGLKSVIPTKKNEPENRPIPKLATLVVALGLFGFGLMYLAKTDFLNLALPHWLLTYGYWFVPSIFSLRAIGDFNYLGLFKRVKDTDFAIADKKYFVPLCLTIGIAGFLIQVLG